MEHPFPFGLPQPTAFYLSLYVLTFVLHQAPMHYVLAGSLYVAWATIFPGDHDTPRATQPSAATIRDWMPFGLSAAITAGVAPLLFVQIVYPRSFYTANLLLSWRWMIVIPVLIVVFYLLYVVRSSAITKWPFAWRIALVMSVACCFLFVGFCWTTNHLLSMMESAWPTIYLTGELPIQPTEVGLRMLVWTGGAFPLLGLVVGWQLRSRARVDATCGKETRRLCVASTLGLIVAVSAAAIYVSRLDELTRVTVTGPLGWPYLVLAAGGALLILGGWAFQFCRNAFHRVALATVTLGYALALVGTAVVRESIRLVRVDYTALISHHEQAASIGGLSVFVVCALVNSLLIIWCVWLVRRGIPGKS